MLPDRTLWAVFVFPFVPSVLAQLSEQVVSTFIYTHHGDRTPFIVPTEPTLTPLGAQQLYQAGVFFRDRYVWPAESSATASSRIREISPYQLDNGEVTILATDDQFVSASAQAFLQGLYPPLTTASNYTYIAGQSPLANGTNIVAPLNGFQYPNILTATSNDLNSIYLEGMNNCPTYADFTANYYKGQSFQTLQENSNAFYTSLQPGFLDGYFSNASVGYYDAYYIWDYLNYAYIHNSSVADTMSAEDLTEARILADDWIFAMYANTSNAGSSTDVPIGTIAGSTLATRILEAFYTTINTQGQSDKLTLLFGGFEPMVSFAALAGLVAPQNAAFYNTPGPGASFVFEMFSLGANDSTSYPDPTDLYVRFLYSNGTGDGASFIEYPLFGQSPSVTVVGLADFISGLENFMIFNTQQWCSNCNSYSVFCPAFTGNTGTLDPTSQTTPARHGLSPAVAGVVGAIVALIVAALLFSALMLAGFRFNKVHNKRRSELGGFKGAEKLASDQDLTLPKGGADANVIEPEAAAIRGHERVGSWELRDQARAKEAEAPIISPGHVQARRPSFEDDDIHVNPFTTPVKPHDHV